jgi:high-affinity iron transporter
MLEGLIIMFRETLEAALIVGIIFGYLKRSGNSGHRSLILWAILTGVVLSAGGAFAFEAIAGGFEGKNEELFEGITMLVGAGLLTTMIFWMMSQSNVAAELERRVERELSKSRRIGLFLIVTVSILREGIESVIFLNAARYASGGNQLLGAGLGILAAIVLSFLLFFSAVKVKLRTFFAVSNIILILFAAGLVAHGLHELQEAGVIPVFIEHVWDINPEIAHGDSYPLLHENGHLGSLAMGLFGYNGNPSLLEVVFYLFYIAWTVFVWVRIYRSRHNESGSGGNSW